MPAAFALESRLPVKLVGWQMTQDAFSLLCQLRCIPNCSKPVVHRAISGQGLPFGGETATGIEKLIAEIDELVAESAPLKIDLRNPALVNEWLEMRRKGLLKIQIEVLQGNE